MAWGKAGSTTLSSTGDDIDITSLSESKTRVIMSHVLNSGACQNKVTFNDTGSSKYACRIQYNDDAEDLRINQNFIPHWDGNDNASNDQFVVSYFCDVEGEEKLGMYWSIDRGTAGAGNTIRAREVVYKFIDTPKITRFDLNNQGSGDYGADSNVTILGSEITPAAAVPALGANVQVGSRYEETDTRKMYNLQGASTTTYETDFSTDPTISSNDTGNNYYDSTNDRWYIQWDWDNTNDAGSIDLYSKIGNQNLSDSDWTVRFKYTIVSQNFTSGSDSKQFFVGLTSTDYSNAFWYPDSSNVSTNFGFYMDKSGTYQLYTNNNSTYSGGTWTNTSRSISNETLYVELIRENSTTAKMNLYSDSTYSTLLVGVSLTIASGLTGLRYLSVKGMRYSSSGTITSNMDDLEIYNDISSVLASNTWQEIGA